MLKPRVKQCCRQRAICAKVLRSSMLGMFKEHKVASKAEKEEVRSERTPGPDHLSFLGHW